MAAGWRRPETDLKEQSPAVLEQSLALSFALCAMVFLTYQEFDVHAYQGVEGIDIIQVEEIPETRQMRKPPPPQRPQIPIATQDEDVPDDVTIADTDLNLDIIPPPPPPPKDARGTERVYHIVYEIPPRVKTRVQPDYPEIARKAGVEGRVTFTLSLDEEGIVREAVVVSATPEGIFEEAARKAVMQWTFSPAMQQDRPIAVYVGMVVEFKLHGKVPPD